MQKFGLNYTKNVQWKGSPRKSQHQTANSEEYITGRNENGYPTGHFKKLHLKVSRGGGARMNVLERT